ncbi:MAG: cardiolipin synthase [Oscillospiraceae bacterium]|nr:cardiolipin synthase [Oscillospiraceae bacterium]MDD7294230.1 cardiolipin synthase [Oscillospiraceae bacterium]MDY2509552.1 cardiolipin synthase [Ruminococcus callidus]
MLKKIWKFLFSQNTLYILLMLIQLAFLVLSVLFLNQNYAWVYGALLLLNGVMIIYITNSRKNPSYKISWLVVIAVLPIFGGLSYLFLKTRKDTRNFFHNYEEQMKKTRSLLPQEPDAAKHLLEDSRQLYNLSTYLQRTGFPVYEQTNVTYFPLGEDQFAEIKNRLRQAKRFIFIEYFIIAPGKMWDEFLEILIDRARAGVEIRLMYDGIGTKFFSTDDFIEIAKKHHIQCKVFNPFRPLLSSAQNNRDHRKILVIDGNIAFNGGTNLADEYINEKVRFGHWKDTAIMLEGAAVWSYTMMFLQLWNMHQPNKQEAYAQYRPTKLPKQTNGGFIQPFGDSPTANDLKGVMVYLDLISNAKRYIYIETPYLIPDHDLLTALKLAAEKGVDVRIITPHIPDKWYVYQIAWNYYRELLEAGVKIFEYTPGFIHAKCFVVDDELAVLGTINLDYRSLYLHFECASLIYRCDVIQTMLADFLKTQQRSQPITLEDCKNRKWYQKCNSYVLGLFAPLL